MFRERMRASLREPLLHFLLLGAALFVLYGWIGDAAGEPDEIVITERTVEGLAHDFLRVNGRPPSRAELDDLIAEQTKEEVFHRSAIAAGLDRDDSIIRRRLRLKMEFATEDELARIEPSDAELERYATAHAGRYRAEGSSSLPPLPEIRDRVASDWRAARRVEAADALYEKLRAEYRIRVEPAPNALVLDSESDAR